MENGIAVVTFDLPGEPVNKLSDAVKVEFEALLIRLRDDTAIRAAVLISGKPRQLHRGRRHRGVRRAHHRDARPSG